MIWEPHEGNQRRCREHAQVFPKTSTCSQCAPGMGSPVAAIVPVSTDKDIQLLEDRLRASAIYYDRCAREKCAGTDSEFRDGLKAAEVSLKFDRAYKEILEERKSREHDVWLVEQNRLLKGDGGS